MSGGIAHISINVGHMVSHWPLWAQAAYMLCVGFVIFTVVTGAPKQAVTN